MSIFVGISGGWNRREKDSDFFNVTYLDNDACRLWRVSDHNKRKCMTALSSHG